jgi:hypothetical protein
MFTADAFRADTDTGKLSPRVYNNPGVFNTPRKTPTYDACCSIDFFSRVLEYDNTSGSPFNIIELVNTRCQVTDPPAPRFNRVFQNMLNTFNNGDIDIEQFNTCYTLFTTDLPTFWNNYSRGGSSLFTEIFNIPTRKLVEDSKYNAAGLAKNQCNDILGKLTPTSRCMYCGVLAGNRANIVPILSCEHLLEVLMLFMTIGLAPNKKMYTADAYNLVRDYLITCGCYTYACYHCNMVKAQVQLSYSGIFITIKHIHGNYMFGLNEQAVLDYGRLYFTKLYFAPPSNGQKILTWYLGLGSYITDLVINYLNPAAPTLPPIDLLTSAAIAFPLILTKQHRDAHMSYIKTQPDADFNKYGHNTYQINDINQLRDFLHQYYFDMSDFCDQFTPFIRDLEYRFSLHALVIGNVMPLCNILIAALNRLIAPPMFSDIYNLLGYGILKVFSRVSVSCGNTDMRAITSATVYGGNTKKYNLKGGNIPNDQIYQIYYIETATAACDNEDEDEATTQLSSQKIYEENMDFIINNILLTFKMGQIQPPNDEGIFNYINAMSELTETDKEYIFNKSRETVNDINKMAAFNTSIDNQYKIINEYASKTIEENRQAINILRQETNSLKPHATPPPHYQTHEPPQPPATPPPQYQAHGPPRPPATPPPQYQAQAQAQAVEYIINTTRQRYHGDNLELFMAFANGIIDAQQISLQDKQYISNLVRERVARGYGGKKRKNKRKTKRRKQKKHLKRKTRKA